MLIIHGKEHRGILKYITRTVCSGSCVLDSKCVYHYVLQTITKCRRENFVIICSKYFSVANDIAVLGTKNTKKIKMKLQMCQCRTNTYPRRVSFVTQNLLGYEK